jgi:lipopolysaccharide export system permease protein
VTLVDRYIVRQLAGPFIFFLFIFGGILWLNQALLIINVVIENGQPGMVFLELSSYLLPRVIEGVFPVAGFAAALYLTNRLYAESEYAALMAAGLTPTQFARPFFIFGGMLFVIVSMLIHFITPISNHAFQTRQYEIRQEYLSQLIKVGEFISPKKGVTFYFGNMKDDGLLEDILIRETNRLGKRVIHTAPTGRLVGSGKDAKLLLNDGTLQQYDQKNRLLNVVQFDSFSYDLGQFAKDLGMRSIRPDEIITPQLPWNIAHVDLSKLNYAITAQFRVVKAFFTLLMPVLGAAILFSGNFSRSGFFYRIIFAIMLLMALNTLNGAAQSFVTKSPSMPFVLYLPVVLSIVIILFLIQMTKKGWNGHNVANLLTRRRALS